MNKFYVVPSDTIKKEIKVGKKLLYWEIEEHIDLEILWEDLTSELSHLIEKKNPTKYWKAEVKNFGWRSVNGFKVFRADNGQAFLGHILPRTNNIFQIYNYGKGFAINNFHHDSPTGKEWYYILPCSEKQYNKLK